jgi:hypothetical protein
LCPDRRHFCEHVKGLANVQELDLGYTDAGVAKLQKALPNCNIYY